ncbi:hypothetical protein V9T40_004011 [Parthenolecanium corni]|uniref:C2H2-type domain-containing protein n=1 Tax=Parthenolecanium corni TaxID=536013 RepID=A0AAN9TII8_9HEMI
MDNCYIPNNLCSQYGLEYEEAVVGSSPITPTSSTQPQFSQCVWNFNPEEMGSFSISPLDLQDSVSSNFFPASPCSSTTSNNNCNYSCKNDLGCFLSKQNSTTEIKQPHDMADVLLSLKHAIVHPGQLSPTFSPPNYYQSPTQCAFSTGPSASLSCTVYPHQVPSLSDDLESCDTINNQQYSQYISNLPEQITSPGCNGNTLTWSTSHSPSFLPGMSVNVSMNMTMQGYPPSTSTPVANDDLSPQVPCHQLQWPSLTPNSSPVYQSSTQLFSPIPQNNCGSNSASGCSEGAYAFAAAAAAAAIAATDLKAQQSQFTDPFSCGLSSPTSAFKCSGKSSTCNYPSPTPSASPSCAKMAVALATNVHHNHHHHFHNNARNCTISGSSCNSAFIKRGGVDPCADSKSINSLSPTSEELEMEDKSKPNLCRICGKTYARPSTLKTHLRTHSGEKPYRCEDCNKSFSQAANLTAHVRTHSGEKPFRCPICGRRFSQSSSVTTHMRTHSGERPYRCRMCKKAFSDSSTLTKHLRIHSGEKPYQCKLCQLRFSQSGNLNRHMRVHNALGANILFS